MPASTNDKQVFDVAKPGKTAASATSRPVIVNHGSLLKDPMMSDEKPTESAKPAEAIVAPSESRKVITPPSAEAPIAESKDATSGDDKSPSDQAETTPKPSADNSSPQTDKDQAAAIVDAVVDQAAAKKKGEPTKEEVARLAEMEKLVEEQKYFVSTGHNAHHHHRRGLFVFLILLVILAGAYLAADAGLINVGVELPTDLIKN